MPPRRRLVLLLLVGALTLGVPVVAHAQPAGGTLSGTLVEDGTGSPAPFVLVLVRRIPADGGAIVGVDLTRRDGRFAVPDLVGEEFAVQFIGFFRFESGFLSCSKEVVPTFGEACTTSAGELGDVRIERR